MRSVRDLMKFIGIPYVWGGREFDGADCYGVIYLFYRDLLEKRLPTFSDQPERDDLDAWCRMFRQELEASWVPKSTPEFGDVMVTKLIRELHCGVYIGNDQILHTRPNVGSFVDTIKRPIWKLDPNFYRLVS